MVVSACDLWSRKAWGRLLVIPVLVAAMSSGVSAEEPRPRRFGGAVAVPASDLSGGGPAELALAPRGGPVVVRTHEGRFFQWRPGELKTPVALTGDRLHDFSPNGVAILTSRADGRVTRWRLDKGQRFVEVASLTVAGVPEMARFSSDGHHVVVASTLDGGKVRRFTLFGGAMGLELQWAEVREPGTGTAFAVSESRLAYPMPDERAIRILSLPRFEPVRSVRLESGDAIRALAFRPTGELVAVQGRHIVRWNGETGAAIARTALPERCGRVALASDGSHLVCAPSTDSKVAVTATILDVEGRVRATAMAPYTGQPVFDATATRIAFPGSTAVPAFEMSVDGVIGGVAAAPKGKGSAAQNVAGDVAGDVAGTVSSIRVHEGQVLSLDGRHLRAWDPVSGTELWRSQPLREGARTFAAFGQAWAVATQPLTTVLATTGEAHVLDPKSRPIVIDAVADGSRLALLEADGRVLARSKDEEKWQVVARLAARPKGRERLALSPGGSHLAVAGRLFEVVIPSPEVKKMRRKVAPKVVTVAAVDAPVTWLGSRLITTRPGVDADRVVVIDAAIALAGVGSGGVKGDAGAETGFESRARVTALGARDRVGAGVIAVGTSDGRVIVTGLDGRVLFERAGHRGAVSSLAFDGDEWVYSAGEDGVILGWALPRSLGEVRR
jgi:hypothetical protein